MKNNITQEKNLASNTHFLACYMDVQVYMVKHVNDLKITWKVNMEKHTFSLHGKKRKLLE